MATEIIIIECTLGIGLVGCKRRFEMGYEPGDFEGMTREEIDAMVNKDAFDHASEHYIDLHFELPEGLGEETKTDAN